MPSTSPKPKPLHLEHLTWTSLLGHWMNFARAAMALPKDGEGPRWKASVPAVITLQAVTFALADLNRLALDERALARDRAELLIDGAAGQLHQAWAGAARPALIDELVNDSRLALQTASQRADASDEKIDKGDAP